MYGRGNYAPPQFGQGLQRPMPPYQQPPTGHPPPLQFQPRQPFPMQPGIQQGGPPHGGPPLGPGYPHIPPAPLNMPPNAVQQFLHRPLVHGGPPPRHPYPGGQQNFHHGAPPPPPPSIGAPRALPPPPLQHPGGYGPSGSHSTPSAQQGVHHISLPRPPPPQTPTGLFPSSNFQFATQQLNGGSHMPLPSQLPSSMPTVRDPPLSSLVGGQLPSIPVHVDGESPILHGDVPGQNQILESESTVVVKTDSGGELPPPPPKPEDEAVLRNIEILCQFIAKNGIQFEEMARKNESGNPKFSFLVGGDPGSEASCAREYYLWMKKKCGILNDLDNGQEQKNLSQRLDDGIASAVLSSSANVATVHSPADSDVDMEDDFFQTDKEPEVYTLGEDLKPKPVSCGEVSETQKQESMLLNARDSGSASFNNFTQSDKEPEVYTSGEDLKSERVSTREVSETQKQETVLLSARDGSSASFNDFSQTDQEPEVYTLGEDLKCEPVSTVEVLEMQKQESTPLYARDNSSANFNDIAQTDKEPEVYTMGEDLKSEPVSTVEVLEMQKQETTPLYARDSTSALNSNSPVKLEEETETKPDDSSVQLGRTDIPFRLIQNYDSDDNSEDELPHEQGEAQTVLPPPKSGFSTFCDDFKSGTTFEPGLAQSVTACVNSLLMKQETVAVQNESQGTLTKGYSSGKHGSDDRYDGSEPSNLNTAFQGRYATETSVDIAGSKDVERKDKKSTSTSPKVDEFGRLVKEVVSDSESDGTRHVKRRGRRDRSRSRSRSPPDRRRRRSPYRRKSRRSRSRSRSPKRRRSRSRSPYRSRGDFGGENLRRGRVQPQECFDFLKGKCYRGASCKYKHIDVGNSERYKRSKDKPYQVNVASGRNSEFSDRVTSSVTSEYDDMEGEKMLYHTDKHDGDDLTPNPNDENYKVESTIDVVPNLLHGDVENSVVDFKNSEGHMEEAAHVQEASGEHTSHHSLVEAPREADGDLPKTIGSSKTDSSIISPSGISTESYQGLASKEPKDPIASISNFPNQISHSPMPPLASPAINAPLASPAINAPQQSEGLVEYNSITPSVSFPHHTVPLHVIPPYNPPLLSQQSRYPGPPNSAWSILPPSQQLPPHLVNPSNSNAPLQFQQGTIPLRTDFLNQMSLRAQSDELAGNSQVGGFQYQTYSLPSSNVPGTPFVGPSLVRDDRLSQFPSHGHPGVPPRPGLFPGDSNVMQSFPGSNLLAGGSSKEALHNHPSRFVDVGQSRISAHYNPYASTFDQPLSSRFSSTAFAQERVSTSGVQYGSSFNFTHGPIEGQTTSGYGDQYDPLFDSIDPSSKRAQKQDHGTDNSDMFKVDTHHRVLDVAENKQKEVGAPVGNTSPDNDEYGETGDAEVGAVENGSLSDSDDDAIVAEGDIEIDQIKPGENNKTGKESRSMRLFKVAVANFVKEVLKPQWRQGNMSKEVFKTIVKKTVDKVSGAMKNHRVPKSQAKIDHYIDSSRRKLTQLVEGYVSKYKS